MSNTGRIPLWLVGLVGGLAALTVVSLFIYGAYSGLGSSL
jgi:photosystem II PsbJ protein